MDLTVSRRTLFAGAGLVGASTLVGSGWARAEDGPGNDDTSGVPLSVGVPMTLAVTPGLAYVGMSGYSMQSRSATDPVTDIPSTGAGPAAGAAIVNNDIAIPHGAIIKEFYLSGSPGVTVAFRRQTYGVYNHTTIVEATTPVGVGLVETKVTLDPPFTHDASTGTFLFRASLAAGAAISSMAIGYTPATVAYVPLPTPKRCFDTRANALPGIKGKVPQGQERIVDTTLGATGVPAGAKAVVGNVTVSGTEGSFGWVDLRPNGVPYANTSTVNFTGPNQTVANGFTASVGAGATLTARCDGVSGVATDIIIDIVGYYI
jgi:hypothetical protein